jgi:hypothetical protein
LGRLCSTLVQRIYVVFWSVRLNLPSCWPSYLRLS